MATVLLALACGPKASVDRTVVDLERDGGSSGGPNGGRPGPVRPGARNGLACSPGTTTCVSGHCVDGVCCDSACVGTCQRCNLAGSEGRCTSIAKNDDPDNECEAQAMETCGTDGSCDGAGACQRHAAGTICRRPGCENAIESAAGTCDGLGVCQAGATKSCAPAVCIEDSCGAPCATHADCQAGFWCDGGTCRVKRDPAAACTMPEQCMSGFCADGVCCGTACELKCHSCRLEGSVGTCTPIPANEDPKQECPPENQTTCRNAGGCDGKGACRLHAAGTFCAHATCMGSTAIGISTCDGMGSCKAGPRTDCAPYVCNGIAGCWTACANDEQCKSPRKCMVNACR